MIEDLKKLRKNRSPTTPLTRGEIPNLDWKTSIIAEYLLFSILIFCATAFVLPNIVLWLFPNSPIFDALLILLAIPASLLLFWFYPVFAILYAKHKTGKAPKDEILAKFNKRYRWLEKYCYRFNFIEPTDSFQSERAQEKALILKEPHTDSNFRLYLGQSTGRLIKLWHRAGLAANQKVCLNLNDACQNILVLGGIGSGKTTGVMQPLLLQCLDQNCGGLIFDIKGDVKGAVQQMSAITHKELVLVGPGHLHLNLLEGLTPEVAASFLKSAFLLNGKGSVDAFWMDTATELCRNTLGLLSFLPGHYNLQTLYLYLFEEDYQKDFQQKLLDAMPHLLEKQQRLLKTYRNYYEKIFLNFDPKIKSGVFATVAQTLAPFSHPELMDAFCSTNPSLIKMEELFNGKVYLVDLPLSLWGLGGKVAYTFIKLRFFNLMQNRHHQPPEQRKHPVFFMCDEFQEIVSANREGLSDLNFWDKARTSKTIGIISSQSIASFYAALGSHDLAHALLQNFRQKLCLRTEDPITLNFIENLMGHARIKKRSQTRGGQHSSETLSDSRERVVDAQLFRELNPRQAVAILSLSDHSMDDVLMLTPVYTNPQ